MFKCVSFHFKQVLVFGYCFCTLIKFNKVWSYRLIIISQAFNRQRTISSSLGLISDSQSKKYGFLSPNKNKTSLSLSKACGMMIEWYDQLYVKLELVSWHVKIQTSALQTFANVFVE